MKTTEARAVLLPLKRAGVPFLVIGSMGVALRFPYECGPEPADCDLLLPASETALNGFVREMNRQRYQVSSWGEEVRDPLDMKLLRGRFYLRATRSGLIFDATYECEYLPFARAWRRREWVEGVPCARLEDLASLMRVRNSAKDRLRLERIRRLMHKARGKRGATLALHPWDSDTQNRAEALR